MPATDPALVQPTLFPDVEAVADSPLLALASASPAEPPLDGTVSFRTRFGAGHVFTKSALINSALWQTAFAGQCKDHRYYEIIEHTLPGKFDYRYFVLENEREGRCAIQPFFFVTQDLTTGLPAWLRPVMAAARKVFPGFLKLKMLMVGCAAGEGQLACSEPWAVEALHEALAIYTRKVKTSLILLKEFPASYRTNLAHFANDGYTRIPSMPATRMALSFASFEEYMEKSLGKVFRKNLRRKFKHSARHPKTEMEMVRDVTPVIDEVHALYRQVLERSDMRFEELTKAYLCELGQRMPDRVRFFVWRQEGKIIAFSVCMVHGDTLYDNYLGLDYSVALDLHLYFVTFRDIMQWAIGQGLRHYYSTPLNYDPKLHLRFDLDPLDLYVRHPSRFINPLVRRILPWLEPTRYDPLLRKFQNSASLWG